MRSFAPPINLPRWLARFSTLEFLKERDMANWYIADLHFGHARIIEFCNQK